MRHTLAVLGTSVFILAISPDQPADSTRATTLLREPTLPTLGLTAESAVGEASPAALLLKPGSIISLSEYAQVGELPRSLEVPEAPAGSTGRTVPWLMASLIAATFILFVVMAASPSSSQ